MAFFPLFRTVFGAQVFFVIVIWLPLNGSRSIGEREVSRVPEEGTPSPSNHYISPLNIFPSPSNPSSVSSNSDSNEEEKDGGESGENLDLTPEMGNFSNPCALLQSADLAGKLVSYEGKPLITASHPIFDVSHGVVSNILYTVEVEIGAATQFSLDYWLEGPSQEVPRAKRRHQRDHLLQLFPKGASSSSPTVPEPDSSSFTFCSKSSLAGENRGNSPLLLSFSWYLNANVDHGLSPSNVVFRLRLSPMEDSNIFEQNINLAVRPECYLLMKVEGTRTASQLTLTSLWSGDSPILNSGLNCTVHLVPRPTFGLEIRIKGLSIYGMRDICKGRYLTFSRTMQTPGSYSYLGQAPEVYNYKEEFPTHSYQLSPLGRKVCGKLEDYSAEERLLTFISSSAPNYSPGASSSSSQPLKGGKPAGVNNLNMNEVSTNSSLDNGLLLRISLPSGIKPREAFALDIRGISPCQHVLLRELEGEMRHNRREIITPSPDSEEDYDECSIIIHVPYGYKIITRMVLRSGSGEEAVENEDDLDNDNDNSPDPEPDTDTDNNGTVTTNRNRTSNGEEDYSDFISPRSYECPTEESDNKFMIIRAQDLQSSSDFMWCFDAGSESSSADAHRMHKRAWKSSGNKVKISFQLKYFSFFHLTYHAVPQVEEIVGQCDPGWVAISKENNRCVMLMESGESWTAAEEKCQLKGGGHLVTIQGKDDEYKLQKIISESALFHPSRAYWIGANDRESEGNFQWTSGLPFSYKNWFTGWTHRHEISNAQPNDDGWSGQDCVEIRQVLNPAVSKSWPLSSVSHLWGKTKGGSDPLPQPPSTFFWNDRNCDAKNFFICERAQVKNYEAQYSCNRTVQLSPNQETALTLTSPAYPAAYPDNIVCLTLIETVPGYRILLSFDEFVLEESPGCEYDALEITEIRHDNPSNNSSHHEETPKRVCGDWTKRLKLLRYKTESSSSSLSLKFEADFSHHFSGYKATVFAEKDISGQCGDDQMKKFKSHCYLAVSYPSVNWKTAQQICASLQGKLASVVSMDEWKFVTQTIKSTSRYDKTSTFWIGGSIDKNNQLVWADRMPFNFSAFHSSDLQTLSDWKCLRIYWHEGWKEGFAWKLADCNQPSGYICKKPSQVGESRTVLNKSFSGNGGRQQTPNFPSNYPNNVDLGYHLVAPGGTQIVIRFSHLDIEEQENCLYDWVEIIDRKTKNSTRYCGTHTPAELERLDYVSSSNEVDLRFHSDFSESRTGFEITWRAVDVETCLSGRTILAGTGFPFQDAIHSPNFPHYNLQNLNCVYTIVGAAGQRIWLSFQIFELGYSQADCKSQDHLRIYLDGEEKDEDEEEIVLCGNLTSSLQRTSFLSYREKIKIRISSSIGKSGRGFLGRFKAIPSTLMETLSMGTTPNSSDLLTSINYPLDPPPNANLTLALTSPPNYVLTLSVQGISSCGKEAKSYMEIRDPYHGTNGTTWRLCHSGLLPQEEMRMRTSGYDHTHDNNRVSSKMIGRNEISQGLTQTSSAISFRSTFNRLDIRQVYSQGFHGPKWSARIDTILDENFRAKVLADGDRLLKLDGCNNNPCANGGSCIAENGQQHICRCVPPFTGPFCGLSLCDLNPCLFGECSLTENSYKCSCQVGYGGERCDRRMKPCDDNPCSGHGACVEVNVSKSNVVQTSYKCMCHAWWEGPQCESRMLIIPYKPLSQRVIEEPFWLGLITVSVVLGVIGLIWCLKRHFPEKLEKLLNEDLEKNRGISWVTSSGRSPSFRAGGIGSLGVRDPIPGTSQQPSSPPTSRSFLGRLGIRKPSLLSLSSATSNVSGAVVSPHTYENRTFSLDDLLRPSRSMMRTPSPHRRRNYSVQVRRDPAEKQAILQQLVSGGKSSSLDGDSKPITPKPTLSEIIQMSERRLRLASASSMQSETSVVSINEPSTSKQEEETSFTNAAATKAEKKVTFARMLDKLMAPAAELTSSSSCSDVSCAEDTKMVTIAPKPMGKKERKAKFRRSKSYNRGRNSETDQWDVSSSDTTPDPIYIPKFPTRLCISPTGGSPGPSGNALTASSSSGNSNVLGLGKPITKIPKMASADSLIALFRRFSGSNSAPPSPQYSENEGESSTGATPLSTPSSPRNSLLNIRPPALLITPEPNNTIELPVIDQFAQGQGWRAPPASSITLEVPLRDYCLSPIHEVPTPLATPSHSPCHTPMLRRASVENLPNIKIFGLGSSEENETSRSFSSGSLQRMESSPPKPIQIPKISISVEDEGEDKDEIIDETESLLKDHEEREKNMENKPFHNMFFDSEAIVIPDVLIHVPPDACSESQPDYDSNANDSPVQEKPITSPRGNRPPPLIFANEILSCPSNNNCKVAGSGGTPVSVSGSNGNVQNDSNKVVVPVFSIEYATPVSEHLPKFPSIDVEKIHPTRNQVWPEVIPNVAFDLCKENMPLAPPVIMINQSEAESDSDTNHHPHNRLLRPNLCFLSPFAFAGASDRVPSESNLSTSGYSSMASPCNSRCPSVSPLCPPEAEDYHHHICHHPHNQRRASLTPGTPKKPLLGPRRSSLNTPQVASGLLCDNSERCCSRELNRTKEEEFETDSAVEVETDVDCSVTLADIESHSHNSSALKYIIPSEEMQYINDLLDVPKKGIPKSKSLDIGEVPTSTSLIGSDGKGHLRGLGPSLDSKLNKLNSSGVTIVFPLSSSISNLSGKKGGGNLIEIPEEKERRLSPVSSRSESPLSELSAAGGGFAFFGGSPVTDSDGVYDCGSSEVPANNNETDTASGPVTVRHNLLSLSRLNPRRRKKDRRLIRSNNLNTLLGVGHGQGIESLGTGVSSSLMAMAGTIESQDFKIPSHLGLPPNLAKDLPTSASPKRVSPKRRMRTQQVTEGSSSSSESLASASPRSRSRTSWSSRQNSRNNSPLPTPQNQVDKDKTVPLSPAGGSLEESLSIKSASLDTEEQMKQESSGSTSVTTPNQRFSQRSPSRKISRLRTISHQIRFLRRLELSLIRKKECLTRVSHVQDDRRDDNLSEESSRGETSASDSETSSYCSSCSECRAAELLESCGSDNENDNDNEEPLVPFPSSSESQSQGQGKKKGRKGKGEGKVTPLTFLENIAGESEFDKNKRITKYN